jgi:hypothetical protein
MHGLNYAKLGDFGWLKNGGMWEFNHPMGIQPLKKWQQIRHQGDSMGIIFLASAGFTHQT